MAYVVRWFRIETSINHMRHLILGLGRISSRLPSRSFYGKIDLIDRFIISSLDGLSLALSPKSEIRFETR